MSASTAPNPLSDVLSLLPEPAVGAGNIDKVLHAVRTHLGMDVAFIAEFQATERVFRHVDARGRAPLHAGDALPLDEGYCRRVVDGRLPEFIPNTQAVPAALALPETSAVPIGAHLSVPIRLRDGRVYGTFCCFSYLCDESLSRRDLQVMKAFAELLTDQIEHDLDLVKQRDEKINCITNAIAAGQPSIVFQPIYNLATNCIAGLECLSRFQSMPQRSPDQWFADAAAVGLGAELELRAIRTALSSLQALPSDMYLAINSSPETIISGALTPVLQNSQANRIVLEITEHANVADYPELLAVLAPLRALGARIAIDDAGAGYASMRHILNLQPDVIKLDMSLTRNIDCDPTRRALASALIAFARETHNVIVAEGVETETELHALRSLGVGSAQGFFLGRPMSLADALRLPKRHPAADKQSDSDQTKALEPRLTG
jgi:EAL domain-containing protein (putative c-di-GMP-specific phosphodiesterase class I)